MRKQKIRYFCNILQKVTENPRTKYLINLMVLHRRKGVKWKSFSISRKET